MKMPGWQIYGIHAKNRGKRSKAMPTWDDLPKKRQSHWNRTAKEVHSLVVSSVLGDSPPGFSVITQDGEEFIIRVDDLDGFGPHCYQPNAPYYDWVPLTPWLQMIPKIDLADAIAKAVDSLGERRLKSV